MLRNALEQFKVEWLIIGVESRVIGLGVWISNITVYIVITIVVIEIIRRLIGKEGERVIGGRIRIIKGTIKHTTDKIIKDSDLESKYQPLIYLVLITVLGWNLIGMIPYNLSVSSNIIVTISMSISILIGVTIIGLVKHNVKYLKLLVPEGTPVLLVPLLIIIETISYLARGLSLGVRLGANNLAGHVLIKILGGFIYKLMRDSWVGLIIGVMPLGVLSILIGLELGIAVLQGIVFILLTGSYLRDAISLHRVKKVEEGEEKKQGKEEQEVMTWKNPKSKGLMETDAGHPWGIGFQDAGSNIGEEISRINDEIGYYLIIILVIILLGMGIIKERFNEVGNKLVYKYENHGSGIELMWTLSPALMLIAIAMPSFKLLYLMDEVVNAGVTLQIIGSQWYWSYGYKDYEGGIEYDSYMVPTSDLEEGGLRLLEVDNRIVLPTETHVRIIVTSSDVIHSFAVPSLGVKLDSVPGRLNQASMMIKRPSILYGSCSELCGLGHAVMPIVIEAVSIEEYITWVNKQLEG